MHSPIARIPPLLPLLIPLLPLPTPPLPHSPTNRTPSPIREHRLELGLKLRLALTLAPSLHPPPLRTRPHPALAAPHSPPPCTPPQAPCPCPHTRLLLASLGVLGRLEYVSCLPFRIIYLLLMSTIDCNVVRWAYAGPRDAPTGTHSESTCQPNITCFSSSCLVCITCVFLRFPSPSLHQIVVFLKIECSRITQLVGRLASSASPRAGNSHLARAALKTVINRTRRESHRESRRTMLHRGRFHPIAPFVLSFTRFSSPVVP